MSLNEQKLTLNINPADGEDSASEDENASSPPATPVPQEELNCDGDDMGESETESEQNESDGEDSADDGFVIDENAVEGKTSKKGVRSVVDDKFFNLNEMEAFLDSEDKKELEKLNGKRVNEEDSDDEEQIDYFEDLPESDEEENVAEMRFDGFFDSENKPVVETIEDRRQRRRDERDAKNKRVDKNLKEDLGLDDSHSEEESDEEDQPLFPDESEGEGDEDGEAEHGDDDAAEEDDGQELAKSDFEMRQSRLQRRIEELENDALEPKSWQLKGEIDSTARPKNSLLEEILEFDSTVRPAPLITEETTLRLEDIIKRRIKSKAWDDVERKIKPINDTEDFRKTLVLNQEKSKESLAQIYEKEYLEKLNKTGNVDVDASKQDEPAAHKEIRSAVKSLFLKLDALSNFHFTAKPVAIEAKIITNVPAINMEEVAPLAVSDANLLAPEEVKARPKGDIIGRTERTTSDKKRERRQKKLKQKLKHKEIDKKIEEKEKLGIKVTSKERQTQLMNQVTKSRNVIKVIFEFRSSSLRTIFSSSIPFHASHIKFVEWTREQSVAPTAAATATKTKIEINWPRSITRLFSIYLLLSRVHSDILNRIRN